MDEKYTERESTSTTVGEKVGDLWKVTTSIVEKRRTGKESEWKDTSVAVSVYESSFEIAQQLSVGFLYNRVTEAMEKTGGSSLFDLHLDEKEEVDEKTNTKSN